jgi:hypothetical protein
MFVADRMVVNAARPNEWLRLSAWAAERGQEMAGLRLP